MSSPAGFEGVRQSEAVRVWLLGGFRVGVGSRTITQDAWRLRKAAALVKLLALAPSHSLHREQAMEALWPDSGRRAASNSLRSILHTARKVLDPTMGSRYLASQDEGLVLCPEGDLWVDVDGFEEAAATARRENEPAAYRAAIELYSGELLPEDRYEEWLEARRDELRQLYLALLVELAGLHEERHEHDLAIEVLCKATAEEPTFEEAHAALMRLHALSGRPEQALAQYERLRDILSRGLGTQPGASSRRLRDEIAAGGLLPTLSADAPQEELAGVGEHNLPAPRTSFVGREQEMVEVKRMLAMTRLLTLTGAGGSGKTRLAVEVARDLVGVYPDGVWLVELAGLSEDDLVTQSVAGALQVPERPGQTLTDTLMEALADKDLLLVVDNCEHLVEAAALLVDALLSSSPRLRVLATSRELLGVRGEVLWRVDPLSVPSEQQWPTAEELEAYESVRLFVERALFVEQAFYSTSGFELGPENASSVAQICWRLEGMPLAIELAAAWVGTLTLEQISERLKVSLGLLKGGRTLTSRQRTLRGAMDWSYDLLSEPEQRLFGRLAVFAGGCTLGAAEAVGAGEGVEEAEVLELLWGLVNKSLVVAETGTQDAAARYRMLEPIRQYARARLEENGETSAIRHRHAEFFLALAEEAEPELAGAQQSMWSDRLEGEYDNLRAALSWDLEQGEAPLALRLGGALWRFWHARGYLSEGIRWLEQALTANESAASSARVKALEGMGWLVQLQGDTERAKATYEEMLKLSRELGDKENSATALNSLGTLALAQGDNERARVLLDENLEVLRELENERNATTPIKRFHVLTLLGYLALNEEGDYARGTALLEESLALAREAKDSFRVGAALLNLGYAVLMQGEHERATALCEEALTLARDQGSAGAGIFPEAWVNLGLAALQQGHNERAAASFKEALTIAQEVGIKASIINALEGMASLAGSLDEATRAAHLWGAACAAREVTDIALPSGEQELHEPYLASARSRLWEVAWEEALAEGRAMSLEEAAEYALSEGAGQSEATIRLGPSTYDEPMSNLTPREQEIALLGAQGFTNRQISTELGISERTAGNHVARILKKLGLHSRAQIAGWATEHQLPRPDSD